MATPKSNLRDSDGEVPSQCKQPSGNKKTSQEKPKTRKQLAEMEWNGLFYSPPEENGALDNLKKLRNLFDSGNTHGDRAYNILRKKIQQSFDELNVDSSHNSSSDSLDESSVNVEVLSTFLEGNYNNVAYMTSLLYMLPFLPDMCFVPHGEKSPQYKSLQARSFALILKSLRVLHTSNLFADRLMEITPHLVKSLQKAHFFTIDDAAIMLSQEKFPKGDPSYPLYVEFFEEFARYADPE